MLKYIHKNLAYLGVFMSITKSYNKHTDTYYAYDTTYVWDEKSQRKVQKKVCIGQYDPETGEVIPNAKRGRPSKQKNISSNAQQQITANSGSENLMRELSDAIAEMDELQSSIRAADERISMLKKKMLSLCHAASEE